MKNHNNRAITVVQGRIREKKTRKTMDLSPTTSIGKQLEVYEIIQKQKDSHTHLRLVGLWMWDFHICIF